MTGLPEHPASHQLALLALCGDLVVAIDVMSIREIRRAAETTARTVDRGMSMLDLDGEHVPGWDLGELFGIPAAPSGWVIVELPGVQRRVGLRVGRCVMVQALPVCRAIPRGIFTSRSRAIAAAFSTASIPELADHVSGVVLDLARLLGETELASLAKAREEGREAAREA
jgi:chemotaxis signal transduction protein